MKKFINKILLFSIIPIIVFSLFCSFYIKRDFYFDFGPYKNYSWKYFFQMLGDVSTKKLIHSTTKYNSFIFGSSRTCGLYAVYLQKKIDKSVFFHYANWNESVGGIYAKMQLLDSLGYKMDNIIFYFDTDYTFQGDGRCINDHYLLTKESRYDYYYSHFKNFIPPYINHERFNLLFFNKVNPEAFPNWESDKITNDPQVIGDSLLKKYGYHNFDFKYNRKIDSLKKIGFLYKRSDSIKFKDKQISKDEYVILLKIKSLLEKHQTKYYIVITPLYDQLKFDTTDLKAIKDVLGVKNVYDFSGRNMFTKNEFNYPDRHHFLPYISKTIADSILVTH